MIVIDSNNDIRLYTVEEAAAEINISKQAVYRQIKKEEFKKFIIKKGRVVHLTQEGVDFFKDGTDPNLEIIRRQKKEIEELKQEKKQLLYLLEQQNNIILNSQELEKKALSNTEILLLQKQEEMRKRQEQYESSKKGLFKRLFFFFRLSAVN
ncbi:helix-turn-helix transcriptional regulator [Clostridium massiliamazoniense]|uniref:helix-turn-helix transcriptional regulator n=1 Tax=Clostridium massiliamazoniense TaxID=1347366 RepID=UPI000ABA1780|nr:helix-turn-helix domain-containing protein [Clostridium massiliamazoniense]